MGFSRQEYWSGLAFPPPGDLPDPEIELASPVIPALAGRFFITEPSRKPNQAHEVDTKILQIPNEGPWPQGPEFINHMADLACP